MSEPTKAVFLSYAREDTDAARRIADALRSHGVEAWFDQSELRGGDAWDAKIRKQINECALFLPVVSQHTQARGKGYFRLEWKLAVEQTHLLAEGVPYLAPIVIDDTAESGALVPPEFLRVQWTRLPGALPTPQFVEQIKRLLDAPVAAVGAGRPRPARRDEGVASPTKPRSSGIPVWLAAAAGVALLGGIAFFALRPATKETPVNALPKPVAETKAAVPSPVILRPASAAAPTDEKSIAVLAFADLSEAHNSEYFSDGISEELLNVLAKVPGLKVTARTSSFHFKGKDTPIPEIAQQLGVAYVVEGSVRKQGDKVRITAQLIKAADGYHVWSDTFTRDLKDIFAVQDEIAGLIAKNLELKLGATERIKKVVDPEAYRLVLEGRYFWLQRTDAGLAHAEASYRKALASDPQFAQAHAGLADVWSIRAWYKLLGGSRQVAEDLARANAEARQAIQFDPNLAEAYATLGAVLFNQNKYPEADEQYQTALRLNPNYGFAHHWYAQMLFAQGKPREALAEMDRAVSSDPLAFITLASYAVFLSEVGRYEEALAMNDRAIALRPDMFVPTHGQRANILFNLGRKNDAMAFARAVVASPTTQPRWWMDSTVIQVLRLTGQTQEAEAGAAQLLQSLPADNMNRGFVLAAIGRPGEAVQQLLATGLESSMMFSFIYDQFWDEVRKDPRLPELLVRLNCVEEYRRGRETLEQLKREQEARK